MLNDTMILGIVLTIVISAVAIYLYSYMSYLEKKLGVTETMIVDLRIAMDSIILDETGSERVPAPISPPGQASTGRLEYTSAPAPVSEETDETFYSSVLEQAHEEAPSGEGVAEGITVEEALKGLSEGAPVSTGDVEGMAGYPAPTPVEPPTASPSATSSANVTVNYDAMTRADLVAEAERRGLRVKRSMNRNEVLSLLRRATPTQVQSEPTGAENAPGLFPDAEQLDNSGAVDIGQV